MTNKTSWIIASLTLIAVIVGGFAYYQASEQVAIHWGFDGKADGFAPKLFLILCPLLIPLSDLILRITRHMDPRKANYQKFATGFAHIRIILAMLLFGCIIITSINAFQPDMINIELLITLLIGLMFCVLGNIMPTIRSNFTIGVRNPWTLSNDTVWQTTHRFTGWLWFFGGLLLCLCAWTKHTFFLFFAIFLILCIVPNVYSYILYRRLMIEKEHSHD